MTVAQNSRRREYEWTGSATQFDGPMAFEASDIVAFINDAGVVSQLPASDLTVSRLGRPSTRVTVATTGITVGARLILLRRMPYTQEVDIANLGAFHAESVEKADDALSMQIQQLADGVDRSFRLSDTSVAQVDFTVDDPAPGSLLGWNQDGTRLESYPAEQFVTTATAGVPFSVNVAEGQTVVPLSGLKTPWSPQGVFYNGIFQEPTAYTYTGAGLVFSEPLPAPGKVVAVAVFGGPTNVTESEMLTNIAPKSGAVTRNIRDKLTDLLTPMDFGAVGDGVADDAGPLALALASGSPIDGAGRTFRIATGLSMSHGFELRNCTIDMRGTAASTVAFSPASGLAAAVPIAGTVAKGATSFTLDGALTAPVGTRLLLRSDDLFAQQTPAVSKGEWVIVRSLVGGLITIEGETQDSYSTNPVVYPHPVIDRVVFDGVRFVGDGVAAAQRAVWARRCDYIRFRRCSLQDIGSWGLTASDCRDAKAIDCDGLNVESNSPNSYLLNFSGAIQSAQAIGITGRNYRHVVTAGGTVGIVQNYQVSDVIGYGATEATVDAHPSVRVAQFSNVRHFGIANGGALGDGIVSQALHTSISGSRSGKSKRFGILIQPYCHIEAPSVQITDCVVQGAPDYAVNIDLQYARVRASSISIDNVSAPAAVKGITAQTGASSLGWEVLRLSGGVIDSTDRSVQISATVACDSIEIVGGRYKRQNTTAECIQVTNAVAGNVADIRIQGVRGIGGNSTVRVINPTGTKIIATGNILTGYSLNSFNGITHDGTTVIVADNITA